MLSAKSLQRLLAVQALYQISINELSDENSLDSILKTALSMLCVSFRFWFVAEKLFYFVTQIQLDFGMRFLIKDHSGALLQFLFL